jgi:hypothetical protein
LSGTTPTIEPTTPELPEELTDDLAELAPGPAVRPQPPEGMFTSLADQLAAVRRWNDELGWGFAAEDFDAIDLTPAHHDDPLVVDMIAIYLPGDGELDGVRRTAEELWAVVAEQQPNAWCWDMPKRSNKPVRLLRRIEHRPGLRRVTIDLGAHWDSAVGFRPIEVRNPHSAHAEVLAAAALFPNWVRAIDGVTVPHVVLSGYQIGIPIREAWRHVPCMAWNERWHRINLTDHWADQPQRRFASPEIVTA